MSGNENTGLSLRVAGCHPEISHNKGIHSLALSLPLSPPRLSPQQSDSFLLLYIPPVKLPTCPRPTALLCLPLSCFCSCLTPHICPVSADRRTALLR